MVGIMDVVIGMLIGWVLICVWFGVKIYLFNKEMKKRSEAGEALHKKQEAMSITVVK